MRSSNVGSVLLTKSGKQNFKDFNEKTKHKDQDELEKLDASSI